MWKASPPRSAASLKPLMGEEDNIRHLVTMQSSVGQHLFLAFTWIIHTNTNPRSHTHDEGTPRWQFLAQQDNTPCHTAKTIGPRNLTKRRRRQHGLQVPQIPIWSNVRHQTPPVTPRGPVYMPRSEPSPITQQGIHWSDLLQHVPQMLDLIGIWGSWIPGQHLVLFIKFFGPFMSIGVSKWHQHEC